MEVDRASVGQGKSSRRARGGGAGGRPERQGRAEAMQPSGWAWRDRGKEGQMARGELLEQRGGWPGETPSLAGSGLGPRLESWREGKSCLRPTPPPCPSLPCHRGRPSQRGLRDPARPSPPSCPGVAQPWGTLCAGELRGPRGPGRDPLQGWAAPQGPRGHVPLPLPSLRVAWDLCAPCFFLRPRGEEMRASPAQPSNGSQTGLGGLASISGIGAG